MNERQWEQIIEQLPEDARITRVYTGFEDGETRLIVKHTGDDREYRYAVSFEGDYPRILHKP